MEQREFMPLETKTSNRVSKRFPRGFTLIELLMVIAIIALLMAILMPSLAKARRQAKDVVCQSNLRQWGLIFMMYLNDYEGHFPPGAWGAMGSGYGCEGHWKSLVKQYWSGTKKLTALCPMATKSDEEGGVKPWLAWGSPDEKTSYGINSGIYDAPEIDCWGGNTSGGYYWRQIDNCRPAPLVPILMDATYYGGHPGGNQPPGNPMGTGVEINNFLIDRHDGHINILFCDFSVRPTPLKCLWRIKWGLNFNLSGPWTVPGGVTRSDWEREAPWIAGYPECPF